MFKKVNIFLILIMISIVFSCSLAWGSTPFRQNKPATRKQVFDNLNTAYLGRFFVRKGASETPFVPKGFPQWGESKSSIHTSLGHPRRITSLFGITLDIYNTDLWAVGIGYIDNRMAMICFGEFRADMDYYGSITDWSKVSTSSKSSSFEKASSDPIDLRKIYFYNSSKSRKTKIYTWKIKNKMSNHLPKDLRIIGIKEAAKAAEVI